MNENTKTLTFVAVAALAVVLAFEPWHRPAESPQEKLVGAPLFPHLTDALAPKSMDIVEFDESTASLRPFQVAQVNGLWSIPSHQNYPADAREHLAEATTSLMGVDVVDVVTSNPGEHELYGVIDPDIQKLKPGMQGVGTRVTLKDAGGNPLANLIIGKEIKDKPNLRYVRRAGQDQVLLVALKTDKLSTKFEDWIEKDLLKLNAFDIKQVQLNDYSIQTKLTPQGLVGFPLYRSRIKLAYDDEKSAWRLAELLNYDAKSQEPKPGKLTPDEELNSEKLNTMKSALDDLQIVDVERKPPGLSGDLRASEQFVKNQETVESLGDRGFHAYPVADRIEILSSEGEATVGMKDGVEYVLRFGEVAAEDAGSKKADTKKTDKKKDKSGKPATESHTSRYLFVMARFNQDLIDKPKLEPLPTAAAPKKAQAAGGKSEPATAKSAADGASAAPRPAAGRNTPAASPRAGSRTAPKSPRSSARARVRQISDQKLKQPGTPGDAAAEDSAAEDASATSEASTPAASAPAASAPAASTPAASTPEARPPSAEDEKRAKIQQENKRKQDDYREKVKKGQDHVKELNDRFADWYYHISDDVYQKIHLGHSEVIKTKEKPAGEGNKISDLKALEKGLDDAAKPAPK